MSETTSGETDGPSIGCTFVLKEDVFLFETEPGLFFSGFFKDLSGIVSEVGFSRGFIVRVVCLTKYKVCFFLY